MRRPQMPSRRAFLSAGGACFAGSFLLDSWLFDTAAADGGGDAWQQRWADATHRKFTTASPDPESLSEVWSASPEDAGTLTVECIGPNTVYVRDYDRILAYSRTDGSKRWTYTANEGSLSLPSLVGETLFVQENATVHAIATGDGSARWTGTFAPSQQPFSAILSRDGDAYLPGHGQYFEVHPGTGLQRQSFSTASLGTLVAADADSLFWWAHGTLRSTTPDGTVQWSKSLGRSNPPSGRAIAVTDDAVVVRHIDASDGPTVTALGRDDGETDWSVQEAIDGGVAVTAGPETVYVGTDFQVRALDAATGATKWTTDTGRGAPQPVATPGRAFVPTASGVVPADPASGDQNGHKLLSGQAIHSLAVAPGSLYATVGGSLVGLEVGA